MHPLSHTNVFAHTLHLLTFIPLILPAAPSGTDELLSDKLVTIISTGFTLPQWILLYSPRLHTVFITYRFLNRIFVLLQDILCVLCSHK